MSLEGIKRFKLVEATFGRLGQIHHARLDDVAGFAQRQHDDDPRDLEIEYLEGSTHGRPGRENRGLCSQQTLNEGVDAGAHKALHELHMQRTGKLMACIVTKGLHVFKSLGARVRHGPLVFYRPELLIQMQLVLKPQIQITADLCKFLGCQIGVNHLRLIAGNAVDIRAGIEATGTCLRHIKVLHRSLQQTVVRNTGHQIQFQRLRNQCVRH